tara:strand:- start:7336 stop:8196 length:861 start_codon:yes stop_codon:yes gene_type:complete
MTKIDDQYLHIFTPAGMWGDQILNLFASHYHMENMGKKGLILHTGKDLFATHHHSYAPIESDILKFWTTFDFVKGILFDVDQRSLPQDACDSNYDIFPFLDFPYDDDYKCDLANHIDFSLFPESSLKVTTDTKVAVFQPISLKNKPPLLKNDFICEWELSVNQLIAKGCTIYVIGGAEDTENYNTLYPQFSDRKQIINLMGKISMFEAINLVMNKADFVLSCCSWSAWYGIASRTKTAFAAGPLLEDGTDGKYLNLIKNKDIFYMDYSSKKRQADTNISQWIKKNL